MIESGSVEWSWLKVDSILKSSSKIALLNEHLLALVTTEEDAGLFCPLSLQCCCSWAERSHSLCPPWSNNADTRWKCFFFVELTEQSKQRLCSENSDFLSLLPCTAHFYMDTSSVFLTQISPRALNESVFCETVTVIPWHCHQFVPSPPGCVVPPLARGHAPPHLTAPLSRLASLLPRWEIVLT